MGLWISWSHCHSSVIGLNMTHSTWLKSATETFPAGITEILLGELFGAEFASAWMTYSLRHTRFHLPFKGASRDKSYCMLGSTRRFLQFIAFIRIDPSFYRVDDCWTSIPWTCIQRLRDSRWRYRHRRSQGCWTWPIYYVSVGCPYIKREILVGPAAMSLPNGLSSVVVRRILAFCPCEW